MELVAQDVRAVVEKTGWTPARTAIAALLALLIGLAGSVLVGGLLTHSPTAPRTATVRYLPSAITTAQAPAPDFSLPDQSGQLISLSSLRGRTVLVTFLDPQCKLQCPILGQELGSLEAALPPSVKPVLLAVSVAAGRTPADVGTFTAHTTWQPGWHWLLGDNQAELQAVWASYHVAVLPTSGDVAHDVVVYIVDPKGRLVAGYTAPLPVREVTSVITANSTR